MNYRNYQSLLQPRTARVVQDAGFLRRAGSLLIDLLILDLFITAPFTPIFARFVGGGIPVSYTGAEMAAVIIVFLLIYAYYVLCEYLLGQTLGMMVMRTRVSGKSGIGSMLVRNSFILPFFPFIVLWIVEPLAVLLWRRSVLEHITGTRTIHQKDIIL